MRRRGLLQVSGALAGVLISASAHAGNTLSIIDVKLDRPTIVALGVQMLIDGDDNHNASVTVRYRKTGTPAWTEALPLFRVRPETVQGHVPAPQFGGSIFDLSPGTAYEIELHAVDPDGFDQTRTVSGTTRPVPADPASPHVVNVDPATLGAALAAAAPGDVITLANGMYGAFQIPKGGDATKPVVIRGASTDGVVVDAAGCAACNGIDVYADYVHIDHLTVQHGQRGIRWQKTDAIGGVVRYVHVRDVMQGIHGKGQNFDFYIADNVLEGRLAWPLTYGTDNGLEADWDGIVMAGSGHVVAFNKISGFADALQMNTYGNPGRADDFYGNEILWTYDDGIEMDSSGGNARCFRNRFTNTFDTLSFQPIYGGPAYVFRNVIVNVAGEPMKLHSLGGGPPDGSETSGILVMNNTFVKLGASVQSSTSAASHNVVLTNNVFYGKLTGDHSVAYDQPIVDATIAFDYNGYSPDGKFEYGSNNGAGGVTYDTFAAVQAAGTYEKHGLLFAGSVFGNGLVPPNDWKVLMAPQDVTLATGAAVVDKAVTLPNITDGFLGAAPDLGALELGCPALRFGPRPAGMDESTDVPGCAKTPPGGDGGAPVGDGGVGDGAAGGADGAPGAGGGAADTSSGCGCRIEKESSAAGGVAIALLVLSLTLRRRRVRPTP